MVKTYMKMTSIEPTIESTPSPQKANPPQNIPQPVEDVKAPARDTGIKKPTPAAPNLTTQSSTGQLRQNAVN